MPSVHEILTEQFYRWERRGRGWQVFPEPVSPEPPFIPFNGYSLPETTVDDGRRPTALSSFVQRLSQRLAGRAAEPPVAPEAELEPEPQYLVRDSLVELQTCLPANLDIRHDTFAQFLSSLSHCGDPMTFELLGNSSRIMAQFATHPEDAPLVQRQLQAYFPDATFVPKANTLQTAWEEAEEGESAVIEFGLAREFMFPLAPANLDPFVGLTGAMAELAAGEVGLLQVLFQKVRNPWSDSIQRAVTFGERDPVFDNVPELLKAAEDKRSHPLYGTVVRVAARGRDFDRAVEIIRDLAGSLAVFSDVNGNELVPLSNEEYPQAVHEEDVLRRQSHRTGMLLTSDELIGFVHLPSPAVRSARLTRQLVRTKAAPQLATAATGLVLGENSHAGKTTTVRLSPDQRVKHMHVIGASGTGKSTLLFNLIRQDIENGDGVAVLDPHGDLVDRVLGIIPSERIDDVVVVDPADEEFSVGFNILSAHSDLEKNLLASDLVSVFQRLSTSWGDQMASVLNYSILAFLESSQGGSLSDMRRFLIEPPFRERFLKTVRDPEITYYWHKAFPQLTGNKSVGPVVTRLNTFLAPKPIRCMVSQRANNLDFANILDTGKIFLAKLAEGAIGEENSYLLGSLFVAKFHQMAMSRQRLDESQRRNFWLYVDEFHNFITPSMAKILAGARKYRIGLILAHQELRQLQRDSEVASAVLTNPYTRVVFRVGDADARTLEGGFSSFEARDLQNLGTGEAVCRVERSDFDFNLAVPSPPAVDGAVAANCRAAAIDASRKKYAAPRAEIERMLEQMAEAQTPVPVAGPKAPTPQPVPVTPSAPPVAVVSPPGTEAPAPQTASATKAPATQEAKPPPPPPDLGLGGVQHQEIQKRLKRAAEALRFQAIIEHRILDGAGKIDLLLKRDDVVFACEISVTSPIDKEVGNVVKCLKAGFTQVVVVCAEEARLKKIAGAVAGSLGPDASSRVQFLHPDAFIERLNGLQPFVAQTASAETKVKISHGYKLTRTKVELTPEESKARDAAMVKIVAEDLKKQRKKKKPGK